MAYMIHLSQCPTNKTMRTRFLSGFLIPELLLPPSIIRMFGPKAAIFAPRYASLGTYRACRLIWCPVGWLVGGCPAQCAGCISQDTDLLYLALLHIFKDFQCCFLQLRKVGAKKAHFLPCFLTWTIIGPPWDSSTHKNTA